MNQPERIANLTRELEALRGELQAERNRSRSTQTMVEATSWSRFVALNAAIGQYRDTNDGVLMRLLHTLQQVVDAADPLRASPMSDTARVGHPELTATEAAVESLKAQRATVRRARQRIEGLVDWLEAELTGDKVRVPAKRCHKATCKGKRSPVEARFCINCGRPFEEAA